MTEAVQRRRVEPLSAFFSENQLFGNFPPDDKRLSTSFDQVR
jgi:hypothetical protein